MKSLEKTLELTSRDEKFIDFIIEKVDESCTHEHTQYEGSNTWIRNMFKEYTKHLFSVVVDSDFGESMKSLVSYNEKWFKSWKLTGNFQQWQQTVIPHNVLSHTKPTHAANMIFRRSKPTPFQVQFSNYWNNLSVPMSPRIIEEPSLTNSAPEPIPYPTPIPTPIPIPTPTSNATPILNAISSAGATNKNLGSWNLLLNISDSHLKSNRTSKQANTHYSNSPTHTTSHASHQIPSSTVSGTQVACVNASLDVENTNTFTNTTTDTCSNPSINIFTSTRNSSKSGCTVPLVSITTDTETETETEMDITITAITISNANPNMNTNMNTNTNTITNGSGCAKQNVITLDVSSTTNTDVNMNMSEETNTKAISSGVCQTEESPDSLKSKGSFEILDQCPNGAKGKEEQQSISKVSKRAQQIMGSRDVDDWSWTSLSQQWDTAYTVHQETATKKTKK
eukprot:TRINITY_DN5976_c0_g2_i5.p1 TRINITY_DN5976_c0_g2~~TRINITY_DN5976_c0_g2_i5.p1  ORF type:complete len:452 (-),score=88.06 TRINITY_DN5976_c0_g2_i5:222-1577(-)